MTCPACNGPLTPAEAVAYRGRCENCFVSAPRHYSRQTSDMLNQTAEPDRYVSTQRTWRDAGYRGKHLNPKPTKDE